MKMNDEVEMDQVNLIGKTESELEQLASGGGQAGFHGRQLFHWIYGRGAQRFDEMTDLGLDFRRFLEERCHIRIPRIAQRFVSEDRSVRYLLELADGAVVETVSMPEEGRDTICLSSQVGCPLDCSFCFTALVGMERQLTAGEIVGQVLAVGADSDFPLTAGRQRNLVFMGMGEPFLNYRAVMQSVGILTHRLGPQISPRRITISTAGIVPGIRDLAREQVRPKLAVSLNASTEEQRTALMPITRKYPLKELMVACRDFPLGPRERLTFEYVLLDGVNDSEQDAERVARLLKGIRAQVNLIPYNSGTELPFTQPPLPRILAFQEVLKRFRIPTFLRRSRGQDISAACGQLRLSGAEVSSAHVSLPSSSA